MAMRYKVGKADRLKSRFEQYAREWVTRGIPVRAEVYAFQTGDTFDAERVLRGVVFADGWSLQADGTANQVRPQGTGGVNAARVN